MNISRRSVIAGISALAASTSIKSLAHDYDSNMVPDNLTILFQGDSITDAGRNKGAYYANNGNGMGQGYVRHTVTHLLGTYPDKHLKFYNRGISGHKVFQLRDRWEDDCMMLQPDVLSIMIGVNDFWHTLDWNYNGTAQIYEDDFMALMEQTKKRLPNVRLIIGEPFVLHDGTAIKTEKWKGSFEAYQLAARNVSNHYGAVFIPYQQIFNEALKKSPTEYWCPDGVHPSMAGNFLMAEAWIDAFHKLMK